MKTKPEVLNRFVQWKAAALAIAAVAAFASTPALALANDNEANAGAPGTTPFNGEGDAGVQVLNTGEFPDLAGPLIKVNTSGN